MNILLAAFAIGVVAGLRTMTPVAAVSLAAHLGWISLQGTALAFLGTTTAAIIFSIGAVAELVADKLPSTPNRTKPVILGARLLSGAFAAAAIALALQQSWWLVAIIGMLGAIVGAFGGFWIRRAIVKNSGLPDFPVALVEDCIAVGGALWLVAHLA